MLTARGDTQAPHDFIQAAEGTRLVRFGQATPEAIKGEAADRDVGPAPDDPRVSFRVPASHAATAQVQAATAVTCIGPGA